MSGYSLSRSEMETVNRNLRNRVPTYPVDININLRKSGGVSNSDFSYIWVMFLMFWVMLPLFVLPVRAEDTCSTYGISVSNITNCVRGVCNAQFSNYGTGIMSTSNQLCVKLTGIEPNVNVTKSSAIPSTNVNVSFAHYGADFPIIPRMIGAHLTWTFNTYCENSIFENIVSDPNPDDISLSGNWDIILKGVKSMYSDKFPAGGRRVAWKVGINAAPRYLMMSVGNPELDVDVVTTVDNVMKVQPWNVATPLKTSITDNITLILTSSIPQMPIINDIVYLDKWAPYDLYSIQGGNMPGYHDASKYNGIYYDITTGQLKYDETSLINSIQFKLLDCADENTRSSLVVNWPDMDTEMENQRLSRQGYRTKYPGLAFYDFADFSGNDLFGNPPSYTHNHALATQNQQYSKIGGFGGWYYYPLVQCSGVGLYIGKITDTASWCYALHIDGYPMCSFWTVSLLAYDPVTKTDKCYQVQNNGPIGFTYLYTFINADIFLVPSNITWKMQDGSKRIIDLNVVPDAKDYNFFSEPHLHVSFKTPGTYNYNIQGQYKQVTINDGICPQIVKIVDNPKNYSITVSARSSCGDGSVLLTSSDPLGVKSLNLMLTSSVQDYIIPRIGNLSRPITIGLCGDPCANAIIELKSFPVLQTIDDKGTTPIFSDGSSTDNHNNGDDSIWDTSIRNIWTLLKNIKLFFQGKFNWIQDLEIILFAWASFIVGGTVLVISIVSGYLLFTYLWEHNKFPFKKFEGSKKANAKRIQTGRSTMSDLKTGMKLASKML